MNAEIPLSETGYAAANAPVRPRRILPDPFGRECSLSERWNRFERFYIRIFGIMDLPSRMRARLVIRAIRTVRWKTMIDFGSGRGAYSFYLSRPEGVHVSGIDINKSFVSDCSAIRKKLGRKDLDFACGSSIFEGDRFKPDSIDLVVSVEVLQYLPDIQKGFWEIQRVLKGGGYLICHINLTHRRTPDKPLFDIVSLVSFLKEAGLEPASVTRVFGRAAKFLNLAFSQCMKSRVLAAIVYPAFLVASLTCGGESSSGEHCMVVARKP